MSSNNEPPLVCLVGTFPPPIHGMSQVNGFVRSLVASNTTRLAIFNTAAQGLDRSVAKRIGRAALAIKVLTMFTVRLAMIRGDIHVYMGLSGGIGQILDCLFILVARLLAKRLWVHHHSFAYVDRYSRLTDVLIKLAGTQTTHIVLCEKMRVGLSKHYRARTNTLVLSNAAFFPVQAADSLSTAKLPIRVGFLSNIAVAKGIDLFVEVAEAFRKDCRIQFLIAGPIAEEGSVSFLARAETCENTQYLGPLYGLSKLQFLDNLDVLLFPSKYINEAEPLSVLEAMSQGVAIISTDRGCLDCLLTSGGVAVSEVEFVQTAKHLLLRWCLESTELAAAKSASKDAFTQLAQSNRKLLNQLISSLVTPTGTDHA